MAPLSLRAPDAPGFLVCLDTLAHNYSAEARHIERSCITHQLRTPPMVYYSRRQCSNPEDCADAAQTPSPTVERVLHTMAPSSAPDDHKILRAYVVLAANLILFLALARAGYRALTRPRAAPPAGR